MNILDIFKISNNMSASKDSEIENQELKENGSQKDIEVNGIEEDMSNGISDLSVQESIRELCSRIHILSQELSVVNQIVPSIQQEIEFIKQYLVDADLRRVISISDTVNNLRLTSADIGKDIKEIKSGVDSAKMDVGNTANQVHDSNSKLSEMSEALANIDYNIRVGTNMGNNQDGQYTQMLQEKINEYENDLHLKLMRKYIVDSQLSLYNQIVQRLIDNGSNLELENILKLIISKLEMIGIKTIQSKPGDNFNPKMMKTGNFKASQTTDALLDGKIAVSISPAFVWSLPSVRQQSSTLVLQEEVVKLYEYNKI